MKDWQRRFKIWFIPFVAVWLMRLLFVTYRKTFVGKEHIDALTKNKSPFLLAMWHSNVFLAPIANRNRKIAVVISASDDGEMITRVVKAFGNTAVRGSSTRGGRAALSGLIEYLRQGGAGAVTPDGPLGPRHKAKFGVVIAAQTTGAPVIPFHFHADRQWVLRTWDRCRIPKPFARLTFAYGPALNFESGAEQTEDYVKDLEKALADTMRKTGDEPSEVTIR